MVLIAISVLLFIVYVIGGFFVSLLAGWEVMNTKDLIKIIFWPVAIMFEKTEN